jgi:hypothetical protein
MGDIKRRVDRLEDAILSKDSEEYRHLCFCYNLRLISDEDLVESEKADYEQREIDPEVAKRVYAPIPPDAPTDLVNKAKALAFSDDRIPILDSEEREKIHAEFIEWERVTKEAQKHWLKLEVNT